jgi:hypothetical protein
LLLAFFKETFRSGKIIKSGTIWEKKGGGESSYYEFEINVENSTGGEH